MLVSLQDLIIGARFQGALMMIDDIVEKVSDAVVVEYPDCTCFEDLPQGAQFVFNEMDRVIGDISKNIDSEIEKLQKTIPQFEIADIQVDIPYDNIKNAQERIKKTVGHVDKNDFEDEEMLKEALGDLAKLIQSMRNGEEQDE